MFILVEGMDNTGKSYLCQQLYDLYKKPIIKPSALHLGLEESVQWMKEQLKLTYKYPTIFDRFPLISEPVYGPVIRGDDKLVPHPEYRSLWNLFYNSGAFIIYCRPKIETIMKWGQRDQMEGVKDNSVKLLKAYDDYMNDRRNLYHIYYYDYTCEGDFDKLLDAAGLFLNTPRTLDQDEVTFTREYQDAQYKIGQMCRESLHKYYKE